MYPNPNSFLAGPRTISGHGVAIRGAVPKRAIAKTQAFDGHAINGIGAGKRVAPLLTDVERPGLYRNCAARELQSYVGPCSAISQSPQFRAI